jgi:uncharacterized membrane protein (UPF0127 family)
VSARRGRRRAAVSTTGGIDVAARCELADRMLTRAWGLLGRKGLEPGGGMLIARTGSVHTFFMRFPIDVVFIDRAQTIVKIVPSLRPWRMTMARRGKKTLELPAGRAAEVGLQPGMTLEVGEAFVG